MSEQVLRWDKPERAMPVEEWAAYQPDDGPPGAWVPNMSDEDRRSWKAKLKGQRSEMLSVEIRVSVQSDQHNLAQVLIVVQESGFVVTSQNGKAAWTPAAWEQLSLAVAEARAAMTAWRAEHPA